MQVTSPTLVVERWGLVPYDTALERQLAAVQRRREEATPDTLILVEHPPVYTVGVRKDAARHLLWDEAALEAAGITVHPTNRGGDITYHGPGQLVGYPVVSLRERRDLHAYLRALEDVLIHAVGRFGLVADRREGLTGIWCGERKIAAIGVAVKSWITYHGFALNIAPDLSHFTGIVPCGIGSEQGSVTSMERELGEAPVWPRVEAAVVRAFREVFGYGTHVA
ncbi:MAG: lipoyl(octanoyl) transferase LipB [Opitutales bacterium]